MNRFRGQARGLNLKPMNSTTRITHDNQGNAMLPIRTILHPTDFTEQANCAFQMACSLARDYGAKLVVLHAHPMLVAPHVYAGLYPFTLKVPDEDLLAKLKALKPLDPAIAVK